MLFSKGILGWHTHAGKLSAHPYWAVGLDSEARKAQFAIDFPDFFPSVVRKSEPPVAKPVSVSPPPAWSMRELIDQTLANLVEMEKRMAGNDTAPMLLAK
jgi:hypothetical protein